VGEGFGPHREGEPAELRRDITDELTDHLDCAMRRELVATPDERTAERKVLARFGDSQRIARRLWLDAMKETIMSQRIMLGVVVLLAAACVAASVFAWLSFRQGQQLNQALLARLEDLASRPAAVSVPSDLAVAKIRVVEEGEDGKPVVRAWVRLAGNPFQESQTYTVQERTGAGGVATLGPIRPGTYRLSVFTPARLTYEQKAADHMLFGGHENEKVIVCPRGAGVAPAETDASVSLAWPKDIPIEEVLTRCEFEAIPSQVNIDGFNWYGQGRQCWVTGTGEFVDGIGASHPGPSGQSLGFVAIDGMGRRSVMPLGAGEYRLRSIAVWSASSPAELDASPARGRANAMAMRERADWTKVKRWYMSRGEHEYDSDTAPSFEARAGVVNKWKIDIPEDLLAKLREALAEQESEGEKVRDTGAGPLAPPQGAASYGPGRTSGNGQENK